MALAGAIHALVLNYPDLTTQPWLMAMLGHATVAAAAAVGLQVAHRAGRG